MLSGHFWDSLFCSWLHDSFLVSYKLNGTLTTWLSRVQWVWERELLSESLYLSLRETEWVWEKDWRVTETPEPVRLSLRLRDWLPPLDWLGLWTVRLWMVDWDSRETESGWLVDVDSSEIESTYMHVNTQRKHAEVNVCWSQHFFISSKQTTVLCQSLY